MNHTALFTLYHKSARSAILYLSLTLPGQCIYVWGADTITGLLRTILSVMNRIPGRQECLELMNTHRMLPHIQAHSHMVCTVAVGIARALNATGPCFDIAEIEAAALLHDITKTRSLETGEDHARTGAALLEQLGFERIARIVLEHIAPRDGGAALTPEELISYADKRVLHDRMVTLDERFDYLVQRYGQTEGALTRIAAAKKRSRAMEDKIMHALKTDIPDFSGSPA